MIEILTSLPPLLPIRPASLRDLRLFDWGRDPWGHETMRMAAFFLRNSVKLHISHAMTLGKIKKGFLLPLLSVSPAHFDGPPIKVLIMTL